MAGLHKILRRLMRYGRAPLSKATTSIVPADSIGGRALIAVVAIMTFLASLTTGAVILVRAQASDWQSEVAREVTIQVRPAPGRDLDAEVKKAVDLARSFPRIGEVRAYTKEESSRLLEPWLGSLSLDDLPVPRVIVLKLAPGPRPDLDKLSKLITDQVAGGSLDGHRGWIDRMRAMARTSVVGGFILVALVLAATMLSVGFATRGAMAANRPTIEVLHFIGAREGFIVSEFQRHFLLLGLKGGIIGGGAAILLFALGGFLSDWFLGTAGSDQVTSIFGGFSIGLEGYIALAVQIVLVAAVTAGTSRYTVNRTLAAV